jgi:putative peptidoglycan lipid II flippase
MPSEHASKSPAVPSTGPVFSKQSILQASVMLTLAVFISRAIGFCREIVIARSYGISEAYDIYLVAITFPIVVFSLLHYSIPSVFIPIFARQRALSGDSAAREFFENFIGLLGIIFFLLAVLFFLGAPYIIRGYAPSLADGQFAEAVRILRLVSIIVFFGGIFTVLKSVLNAYQHFLLPAVTPLFLNIAIILSVLFLSGRFAIGALAVGLVVGHFAQVAVLAGFFLRRWGVCRIRFHFRDILIKSAFAILPIILVIETIGQLNVVIDRFFLSVLPSGGISALNYANTLYQIAISAFGVTLATATFPAASEYAVSKDYDRLIELFSKAIRSIIVVTIPIAILSLFFSEEIVTAVFQRGAFQQQASLMTAEALRCYSIGLVAFVSYVVLGRIYYALRKEFLLLAVTGSAFLIKIALSFWLVHPYAHQGLALATSFAGILNVFALVVLLRRNIGDIDGRRIITTLMKIVLSSALGIGVARWLADLMGQTGLIIRLSVSFALAGMIFMGFCYLLRVDEVRGVFRAQVWKRLFHRTE